jgi:hypothetical protein
MLESSLAASGRGGAEIAPRTPKPAPLEHDPVARRRAGEIASDLVRELLLFFCAYAPLFGILAIRFELRPNLAWVCAGIAVGGLLGGWAVLARYRRVTARMWTVESVEDKGAEVSGYLASYLLPFVATVDPSNRQVAGYAVFVSIAAVIYLRSGLVQINPALYLTGWRVVSVNIGEGWTGYVLTKRRLPTRARVPLVRLTERVYVDYPPRRGKLGR